MCRVLAASRFYEKGSLGRSPYARYTSRSMNSLNWNRSYTYTRVGVLVGINITPFQFRNKNEFINGHIAEKMSLACIANGQINSKVPARKGFSRAWRSVKWAKLQSNPISK